MKISYLVNYLDPQMSPFCDALYELTDHSFQLLQTEAFPDRLIQNHHEDNIPDDKVAFDRDEIKNT